MRKNEPLISALITNDEPLTIVELMKALVNGEKIKLKKADSGTNYYLKDGQLHSETITYLKGIPLTWFNPDIHYVVDYEC